MLLKDKTAILYGGGGDIGGAVARAIAREGGRVFLAGRTLDTLDAVASEIVSAGGKADTAEVDATEPEGVENHFTSVVDQAGGVDISFNMIGIGDVQGQDLAVLQLDDFMRPIQLGARAQFITATTAARHMTGRGRGIIMAITATPAKLALPLVGGFGAACSAIEGMLRTLAAEVGSHGVRVCWLRSAGSPESFGSDEAMDANGRPAGLTHTDYLDRLRQSTLLKRFPTLSEVGEAAALLASDRASAMTGASANITCGQIVD